MVPHPKLHAANQKRQKKQVQYLTQKFQKLPEYVNMRRQTDEFYHTALTWHQVMQRGISSNDYESMDNRYIDSYVRMCNATSEFFAAIILFCVANHLDCSVESLHDEIYDMLYEYEYERKRFQQYEGTNAVNDPKYLEIVRSSDKLVSIYERGIEAIYTAIFMETQPSIPENHTVRMDNKCPIHPNCPIDIYFHRLNMALRS